MSNRAYSQITVKSFDEDRRVFSGVASTPEVDRVGDIVEPSGAKFAADLPLLLFHDSRRPVGRVKLHKPTAEGIKFDARIPKIDEPGTLKDRVDEAWQSVKAGLIKAVSIGFRAFDDGIELMKGGGLKFTDFEILELSLVPVPANAGATITDIKSFDRIEGEFQESRKTTTPGTTGNFVRPSQGRSKAMTTAESIKSFSDRKDQVLKDMAAIMTASNEKGETLDADQTEKYDALKAEAESIDKHLVRLEDFQKVMSTTAKAVVATDTQTASTSRGGNHVVTVTPNLPPGIGFARVAIAKVAAYLTQSTVKDVIEERWPDDVRLKNFFTKAAVPAATSLNSLYAGNLVYADNLASEFVEFLRPQTIVGRLPLRRVPFNIRFASQTTGAVAGWVGQGAAKPVTSFQTGTGSLGFTKIAAIAVITQEIARFSSPSAEALVRDELARAVIERLDVDFIDPAQAAVANVNPASVTNGLTALSSAGTSADNIRTDIQNLLEQFVLNNMNAANVVLIMPNTLALAASLLVNSLGQAEFPGLTINGGTLMGIPVVTSQYAANQSGAGNLVIALDPNEILLADDGQVDVSVSTEASLEMSDAPTSTSATPTGASLVSLWQTNSIGIKAERFVNWTKRRTTAVVYMDDVNWGSIGSPS